MDAKALRDHFAGLCMQSLAREFVAIVEFEPGNIDVRAFDTKAVARLSYEMADAMLAERGRA